MGMAKVEHHVEILDVSEEEDGRPDAERLAEHLRRFGADGWELVTLSFEVELQRFGRCHVLVFKRLEA
jgi:hypothetical protein